MNNQLILKQLWQLKCKKQNKFCSNFHQNFLWINLKVNSDSRKLEFYWRSVKTLTMKNFFQTLFGWPELLEILESKEVSWANWEYRILPLDIASGGLKAVLLLIKTGYLRRFISNCSWLQWSFRYGGKRARSYFQNPLLS